MLAGVVVDVVQSVYQVCCDVGSDDSYCCAGVDGYGARFVRDPALSDQPVPIPLSHDA
jgi:hypothetical protein